MEITNELFRSKTDVLGLGAVIIDSRKQTLRIFRSDPERVFRRTNELEVLRRDLVDLFVRRLRRKHDGNQKLERRFVIEFRPDVGIFFGNALEHERKRAFVHHGANGRDTRFSASWP